MTMATLNNMELEGRILVKHCSQLANWHIPHEHSKDMCEKSTVVCVFYTFMHTHTHAHTHACKHMHTHAHTYMRLLSMHT